MANVSALIALNAQRWHAAKPTRDFGSVARHLLAGKPRYQAVSVKTGVPWFVIAVIHEREASGNWNTQLGQGDPLNQVSRHEPAGRGPFETWEDGAYDALVRCAPFAYAWKDWSAGGALTLLEEYNGLGYANKGIPSPYVWSGTDQYKSGKYVADHDFRANVVDVQLGCAGLLMAMRALDATIRFADEGAAAPPSVPLVPPKPAQPAPATPPVSTQPAPTGGFFVAIIRALAALFGRK